MFTAGGHGVGRPARGRTGGTVAGAPHGERDAAVGCRGQGTRPTRIRRSPVPGARRVETAWYRPGRAEPGGRPVAAGDRDADGRTGVGAVPGRWAVAAHRALIRLIGYGAPAMITGAYPPKERPPAREPDRAAHARRRRPPRHRSGSAHHDPGGPGSALLCPRAAACGRPGPLGSRCADRAGGPGARPRQDRRQSWTASSSGRRRSRALVRVWRDQARRHPGHPRVTRELDLRRTPPCCRWRSCGRTRRAGCLGSQAAVSLLPGLGRRGPRCGVAIVHAKAAADQSNAPGTCTRSTSTRWCGRTRPACAGQPGRGPRRSGDRAEPPSRRRAARPVDVPEGMPVDDITCRRKAGRDRGPGRLRGVLRRGERRP